MTRTVSVLAIVAALLVSPVLADPAPKPNMGAVAQATLAYKAAGYPMGKTGHVISDRNTNPNNTYYQDNGYDGRGDEVSTLAHSD
jgi:hypothetical protein